jgi:hypothetical protein
MHITSDNDPQVKMIIEMNQAKEARRRARKVAAKGLHQRVVQDKRKKPVKHRKSDDGWMDN